MIHQNEPAGQGSVTAKDPPQLVKQKVFNHRKFYCDLILAFLLLCVFFSAICLWQIIMMVKLNEIYHEYLAEWGQMQKLVCSDASNFQLAYSTDHSLVEASIMANVTGGSNPVQVLYTYHVYLTNNVANYQILDAWKNFAYANNFTCYANQGIYTFDFNPGPDRSSQGDYMGYELPLFIMGVPSFLIFSIWIASKMKEKYQMGQYHILQ